MVHSQRGMTSHEMQEPNVLLSKKFLSLCNARRPAGCLLVTNEKRKEARTGGAIIIKTANMPNYKYIL